ncbi:MAG: hypothetical protein FWD75_02440 [Propionibacteriaceae bacterium]|nr:hypothetical protein [Propionibacteriaceae bacterium]
MRFPRLLLPRVAVWTSSRDVAVGGPGTGVVLSSVPRQVVDVIPLLDGRHDVDDLTQVCESRWVAWLLSTLEGHRLLADGPAPVSPVRVEVVGDGLLARRVSSMLSSACDPGPRGGRHTPVLTILASSTVDVDRVMVTDLVKRRVSHLVVRADEDGASVGPFVVPGVTSCVTCCDLARRDLDPTWPVQAFQLSRVDARPLPVVCAWAAATAVAHARVFARGLLPESVSTTIELSADTARVTYRPWPRDPRCACQAV